MICALLLQRNNCGWTKCSLWRICTSNIKVPYYVFTNFFMIWYDFFLHQFVVGLVYCGGVLNKIMKSKLCSSYIFMFGTYPEKMYPNQHKYIGTIALQPSDNPLVQIINWWRTLWLPNLQVTVPGIRGSWMASCGCLIPYPVKQSLDGFIGDVRPIRRFINTLVIVFLLV